jgi:DNA-binding winged helix-turn-helix (wHTH) protein/TolB-like protein/Flp pilus assembly protein TadD
MNLLTRRFYQFGPFRIDTQKRVLLREGELVPLKPKGFDTLLVLVQHHGQVLDKNNLMERLWPDSDVEESNLPLHISALRKTLGENPNERLYIVTVPGRGYRFAAEVEAFDQEDQGLAVEPYPHTTIQIREPQDSANDISETLPIGRTFPGRLKPLLAGLTILAVVISLASVSWLWLSKKPEGQPGTVLLQSIAVLPFRHFGAGGDEYLGLGIADSLITRLSNLREIKLRPTSAVLKYDNNSSKEPAEIGRELGVEAVLEGSIRRDGESIRVRVQLVRVEDGSALWAETFDDKFTSIFKIEDSISGQVAESLVPKLTGKEREAVAKRYTENNEAYHLYLKGRYYWNKSTQDTQKKSIEFFQQATEKDPGYALAFAGLSTVYASVPLNSAVPPKETFPKAQQAAARALELDDRLAEAHVAMGIVNYRFDRNWANAESHLKRAIELNPNSPLARFFYAQLLSTLGRFEEAKIEAGRALELDPLSHLFNAIIGGFLFQARQYDQAIEQLNKALEIEPDFWITHIMLGQVYIQKGRYSEAIMEFQKARQFSRGGSEGTSYLGYSYAVSGDRERAEKVLAELKELSKQKYVPASFLALIYAGLGERNQALDWLEKAYDERDVHINKLRVSPSYDGLRKEPRFISLLQRAGF